MACGNYKLFVKDGANKDGQIIDGHGFNCCVNAITEARERSVRTLNI